MADINEKIKSLTIFERMRIFAYINGLIKAEDLDKDLVTITGEVLLYLIENSKLPDELNPYIWNLP